MDKGKVMETKSLKINYSILKKEGYKLEYGSKTPEYVDVFFSKKMDDITKATIFINEKKIVKRLEGSNYDNNNFEAFTWKEIEGINQIIKQIS